MDGYLSIPLFNLRNLAACVLQLRFAPLQSADKAAGRATLGVQLTMTWQRRRGTPQRWVLHGRHHMLVKVGSLNRLLCLPWQSKNQQATSATIFQHSLGAACLCHASWHLAVVHQQLQRAIRRLQLHGHEIWPWSHMAIRRLQLLCTATQDSNRTMGNRANGRRVPDTLCFTPKSPLWNTMPLRWKFHSRGK